jgi:glucokinase
MIFIAIGTGVGSAIIANGSLIQGSDYMAGEIAYLVSEEGISGGHSNAFGDFGSYENKISGSALSRHGESAQVVFEKYAIGDEKAIPIINKFVTDLSIGIANMVSLLNPRKVIIGGGVSGSLPIVLESIRSAVARLTPIPTTIELSSLGEEAGAIGAIAFAFEQTGILKGSMAR